MSIEENIETPAACALWLLRIARDVRAAGDIPLAQISLEGIEDQCLTLADEIELVALTLDYDGVIKAAASGET